MKKLLLITLSAIALVVLASCSGNFWKQIDPRNDDSITYHNRFVENTNTILDKTRALGTEYSAVLTQVEKIAETLTYDELSQALEDLEESHEKAENELINATSKDEGEASIYLEPFQETYLPALENLETVYGNFTEYLGEKEGKYEVSKIEELGLKIDVAHTKFIETHNTYIDAINLQVQ